MVTVNWFARITVGDEIVTIGSSGNIDMEHIKPGPAQGSAHIIEKVSGPEGTYSALEIMVGAQVPCRAMPVEIAKAQKAGLELCRDMLEEVFEEQYDEFKKHVDKAGRK